MKKKRKPAIVTKKVAPRERPTRLLDNIQLQQARGGLGVPPGQPEQHNETLVRARRR